MMQNLFPMFTKLAGRPSLVVGAGAIAASKVQSLVEAGASVTAVAPQAIREIKELAASGRIKWLQREFNADDLDGVFLVVAATSLHHINCTVYLEAQRRGILCNAVDDPPNCDFYFPAVVRRGALQIAISTGGESPALAQRLRSELEECLEESLGDWVRLVGVLRREILANHAPSEERKRLLHLLAHSNAPGPMRLLPREFTSWSGAQQTRSPGANPSMGTVHLVGAGPGDPELLTVKAHSLIQSADMVLHDDLVPRAIVSLAGPRACVVPVGKRCGAKRITQAEINALMIESARQGMEVVRLKCGDPAVYGRLAEELDALEAARVPFEIVPGITAGVAAAASVGAPLTDRRISSRVVIVSGHHAHENERQKNDWSGLAREDTTLVVYMPGTNPGAFREKLLEAGLPPETPAVIVSRATLPDQREWFTTINQLHKVPPQKSPTILLVGRSLERLHRQAENAPVAFDEAASKALLERIEFEAARTAFDRRHEGRMNQ
jgi:uroporphyrin-III C-methyltransferase / precorrin-2 dehydrogenase / sirohydrochlorin ferrochelatase